MNRASKTILFFVAILVVGAILFFLQNEDWLLKREKAIHEAKKVDGTKIQTVMVESDQTHLHVQKSKDQNIYLQLNGKIPNRDQVQMHLSMKTKEEKLVIQVHYTPGKNPFALSSHSKTDLSLALPRKMYNQVVLRSGQGNIETTGLPLQASHIVFASPGGVIHSSHLSAQALEIQSGEQWLRLNEETDDSSVSPLQLQRLEAADSKVTLQDLDAPKQYLNVNAGQDMDLNVHRVNAFSLKLTTFSGKLNLTDYQGNNLFGDFHDTKVNLQRIAANFSLNGDNQITVDPLLACFGNNQITTHKGKIRVRLAQKPLNLLVSFKTEQGQLHTHLPVHPPAEEDKYLGPTKGKGLLVGRVGDDQPMGSLSLQSDEGDIEVQK